MIPKIIHLIWLGGKLPEKFDRLVSRIKELNHDYEIIEWNDDNINFKLINQNLFDETENLGAKSDILRFEVLNKYGGIYLDYDFYQVTSFNDIINCDFFVSSPGGSDEEIYNSIVGSKKGHVICQDFLSGLSNTSPLKKNEIDRIMNETGPYYLTKIYHKHKHLDGVEYLDPKTFYPFPGILRGEIRDLNDDNIEFIKTFIEPQTVCIHLHTTMWQF